MHIGTVFGTRESRECCLLPADTSRASLCIHDRCPEKKRIILQHITHPYTSSLHGEDSDEWLETSLTSTLQSRCNLLRFPSVWINKMSNVRLVLGDQ